MFKSIFAMCIVSAIGLFNLHSQDPVNSGSIINTGIEYHDNGEYEKAISEFRKVPKTDTNYVFSLYEIGLSQIAKKDYKKAIETCNKGLLYDLGSYKYGFMGLKATAFAGDAQLDSAIHILDRLIARFPQSHLYFYEKGLAYMQNKKYTEAIGLFKKTIELNPYHPNAHLFIGQIAYKEGNRAMGAMHTAMAMLLSEYLCNNTNLGLLSECLIGDEIGAEKTGKTEFYENGEANLDELNSLLESKSALKSTYKIKSKFAKINMAKQLYYLMSNLNSIKDKKGVISEKIVPYFEKLIVEKKFDLFMGSLFRNAEEESLRKKITAPNISKFLHTYTNNYFAKTFCKTTIVKPDGKKIEGYNLYENPQQLFSYDGSIKRIDYKAEKISDDLKPLGYSQSFNRRGLVISEGVYAEGLKENGTWLFYNSEGAIIRKTDYKNGVGEGNHITYYSNGNVRVKTKAKEGFYFGKVEEYFLNGQLREEYNCIAKGEKEGIYKQYYMTGELRKEYNYKDGKKNGKFTEYYSSKVVMEEGNFKDNELSGKYTTYYRNGKVEREFEKFVNGNLEGLKTTYYINGNKQFEGKFKDGKKIGIHKEYYYSGELKQETPYNSEHKLHGTYKEYARNGNLIQEWKFEADMPKSYKAFNPEKADEVLSKGSANSDDELKFKIWHKAEVLSTEGTYVKGEKKGVWKWYNPYGILFKEINYTASGFNGNTSFNFSPGMAADELMRMLTEMVSNKAKGFNENGVLESKYSVDLADNYFGEYTSMHPNGKIQRKTNYYNNTAKGNFQQYYANGNLANEKFYDSDGDAQGISIEYDVSGKRILEEIYENDILKKALYYDTSGLVYDTLTTQPIGIVKTYFPNGKVSTITEYVNYTEHGKFSRFYPNGVLAIEGTQERGSAQGVWKYYTIFGKIETEVEYERGEKNGIEKEYFSDGKLSTETPFIYGNKNGLHKSYNENGTLREEINYINDQIHGVRKFYDYNGKLQHIRFYEYDEIVGYADPTASGEAGPQIAIKNGTAEVKGKFANGKPSREYTIDKGRFTGDYISYYENGQINYKYKIVNYLTEGEYTTYYSNGVVKSILRKKEDANHGNCQSFFENGKLETETNYVYGIKQGWSSIYNKNGKLIIKLYYFGNKILFVEEIK